MPKLTGKAELNQYYALALVISGEKDIFFPSHVVKQAAAEIIANVESETAELRSFLIIMLFTGTFRILLSTRVYCFAPCIALIELTIPQALTSLASCTAF
ncbi:hypothetical protein IDH45_18465 [Paenibacillus sp. IB182363]|uniref:Uncharacterized protein n=1 Tax=Paenibacillus oceani TaxID=2772510 RepID=A0A927CC67_9BACL|nr:hypothetical protein [Paenibacillus oceani]